MGYARTRPPEGGYSRFNFRFPQRVSLRSGLNTRSTCRFGALMIPIRANIVDPPSVAKDQGFHGGLPLKNRRYSDR
jgi:hypothetical protein